MRTPLVEINNLQKHYPLISSFLDRFTGNVRTIKALNGVNLTIHKGETLGLVGESGCGKSTLAKIMFGLEDPTGGFINFEGRRIDRLKTRAEKKALCKKMQMVFQNPSSTLNPRMTVRQVLAEPFEIHEKLTKAEIDQKIGELLEMVGLYATDALKYSGDFSDGQKQRISLVRALSLRPEFIVADEPVSALDVSIQAQTLNLMKRLQNEMHLTMLFISHDLQVVRFLSDRIAVIYLGKILELGPSREFFDNPIHPYSDGLLASVLDVNPEVNVHQFKIIADVPVSQIHIPSGCVFRLKCPEADERCKTIEPEFKEVSKGHFVACLKR